MEIYKLCGFLNSIDLYSKPIVWEYISFPHNIPIVWNLHQPHSVDYLGFVITSNFLENPQPGNDMAFHRIFTFCGNLHIPKYWELYGFSLTLYLWGSKEYEKSLCFSTFPILKKSTFRMFWGLYGFLLHPKYFKKPINLKCLCFPMLFL